MNRASALAIAIAVLSLSTAATAAERGPAFSEAQGPWVDKQLPQSASNAAMTEAWENTLAGVYELALNNDPMLAMAEASYRVGLEQRKIARAALLPQANITYSDSESYSKSRGQFAIGTFIVENATNSGQDSDGYVASLTQPLFDLNAWFTFRSGSELTKQAEATFKQAQQDLIVRVSQAYFTVLRAAANLSAAQAQEAALKAQLEQVQQRFDVGLVAITDVY
ncbi:MAG: TolC family protein, partial [Pseudomonadota bacterium]|nr:TolC family protein [Pseudomonadota bacterium]